jgi:CheY-like chemotaxis protein
MLIRGDILVAEDSKLLLQLLRDALLAHGIGSNVHACSDGEQLIAEVQQRLREHQDTALYILDIVMPKIGGIEAAKQIRALEVQYMAKTAPILFYSSREQDPEIKAALGTCWPSRYVQKKQGARADSLALHVVHLLDDMRNE